MKNAAGAWVGWGLGDVDPKVAAIQKFLATKFKSYAGTLVATGTYDAATAAAVSEMQGRYGLPVTGIFDYASQVRSGFITVAPPTPKVIGISVEGHMSNMWAGPVADTMTILANEGRLHHQPTGYNNGSIPFDNASGVNELARFYRSTKLDDGTPFPAGKKSVIGGYSQGMIVVTDFIVTYLQPGQELAWRAPDILGVLAYGNPCRSAGSVAPWSVAQAGPAANTGLDPLIRLDKLGIKTPFPLMDVYRKGDIFSDNEPTVEGKIKAAIYQLVARSNFFTGQYSALSQIATAFLVPIDYVIGAFEAIISGIGFLATGNNNPHYSPYNIDGGINWVRSLLP